MQWHHNDTGRRAFMTPPPTLAIGLQLLLDVDLDLPRFGGGFLGQFHGQDAVVVLGGNLFRIDGLRKGEAARELAVAALDAMVTLARSEERRVGKERRTRWY